VPGLFLERIEDREEEGGKRVAQFRFLSLRRARQRLKAQPARQRERTLRALRAWITGAAA
jgi:hypothetical protein